MSIHKKGKTLLVTVGSTLFTALTNKVLSPSILSVLPALGITRIIVQYGSADLLGHTSIGDLEVDSQGNGTFVWRAHNGPGEVEVQVMKYTNDFAGLVDSADAVISHAGSGSILTVLRSQPPKPLLVIPNTSLMDNHQTELAAALETDGYLKTSSVESLAKDIGIWLKGGPMKPFPPVAAGRFSGIMDEVMGFAP